MLPLPHFGKLWNDMWNGLRRGPKYRTDNCKIFGAVYVRVDRSLRSFFGVRET